MGPSFVTSQGDALAAAAMRGLPFARRVTQLPIGQCAAPGTIAVFTAELKEGQRKKRRLLFMCPHKFDHRGIEVPRWAKTTPLQVAIHPEAYSRDRRMGLADALKQVEKTYTTWNPWVEAAPWNPKWTHGDAPLEFLTWQERAQELIPPPTMEYRVAKHLTPVFRASPLPESPTLMVIGCAAFNRPHTDVVDQLLPQKMQAVVSGLIALVKNNSFKKIQVVVARSDILAHQILRDHLHPFIFTSVADAEAMLGKSFTETTRLWGREHRRSDAEIGQAFDESASAMRRQLVEPLSAKVPIPVEEISWVDMLLPYLSEASALTMQHQSLLEDIYLERVKTRLSYATLHAVDPRAGLKRTMGNAVLYVAEAMYLRDNPDCVVGNCEVLDTYWKGLTPILMPIWNERVPYIGMMQEQYRQPWGY